MLDTERIQMLLMEAKIIESLVNNNVDMEELYNYLDLLGAVTYQNKLDALFELFYNKLNAIDLTYDFNNLLVIFNNIISMQQTRGVDSDKDITDEDKQLMAQAYVDFLTFINTDLNNPNLDIDIKLDNILKIEKNHFSRHSEIRKLYLYFVMNIAIVQPLSHMDLINSIAVELQQLLETE